MECWLFVGRSFDCIVHCIRPSAQGCYIFPEVLHCSLSVYLRASEANWLSKRASLSRSVLPFSLIFSLIVLLLKKKIWTNKLVLFSFPHSDIIYTSGRLVFVRLSFPCIYFCGCWNSMILQRLTFAFAEEALCSLMWYGRRNTKFL